MVEHYDAFVSYSHAADGRLAPRLQSAIERFARPWWKRRMLRVFRDETGLSASPELWGSIASALDNSDWLILLASPEAAESVWVGREIEHWAQHRDPTRVLLVVTDGAFLWDPIGNEIDWSVSTAAHPALATLLSNEPRWVDMTWAHSTEQLDTRDPRFQDVVAELAAPLRGIAKDQLAGEDVRQHRRTMRAARAAIIGLAVLAIAAVTASVLAIGQRNEARDQEAEARRQTRIATSRTASANAAANATTRLDRALLLGAAGAAFDDSAETRTGLTTALNAAASLDRFLDPTNGVAALDAHPDGSVAAVAYNDGRVEIRSNPEWEMMTEVDSGVRLPYLVEFVNGGHRLAVLGENSGVVLEVDDLSPYGEPIAASDTEVGSGLTIIDVAPNLTTVAVAEGFSKRFEILDLDTREVISQATIDDCVGIRGLDLSPELDRVAVVCENGVFAFDTATGVEMGRNPVAPASGAVYSPDGMYLAIPMIVAQVSILDAATLETVATLKTPGTRPYSLAFTPDGGLLAVGADTGDVAIYEFYRPQFSAEVVGEILRYRGLDGSVSGLEFLPGEPHIAFVPPLIVGTTTSVSVWDRGATPAIAHTRFTVATPEQRIVAVDEQSGTMYVAEGGHGVVEKDFDGATNGTTQFAADARVREVSGAHDLIVATEFEWPEPTPPDQLTAPTVMDLVVRRGIDDIGRLALAELFDMQPLDVEIEMFDPAFASPQYEPMVETMLSPDGRRMLISFNGELAMWDIGDDAPAWREADGGFIRSWSPDGSTVITGAGLDEITIRNADDGAATDTVQLGDGFSISDIRPVPPLDRLLVTLESGEVVLYDMEAMAVDGAPFTASGTQLQASAVDPNGQHLAAIDRSNRLHLWRIDTREPISVPLDLGPGFPTLRFGAAGVIIFDATQLEVIPVTTSDLRRRACALAGRDLTDAEWSQFISDDLRLDPCDGS